MAHMLIDIDQSSPNAFPFFSVLPPGYNSWHCHVYWSMLKKYYMWHSNICSTVLSLAQRVCLEGVQLNIDKLSVELIITQGKKKTLLSYLRLERVTENILLLI